MSLKHRTLGALMTWMCEGCGVKGQVVAPAIPRLHPGVPLPGWALIPDAERGALAFCPVCHAKACRRMAAAVGREAT